MRGKKILIGISGSIAAYKVATLVRLFVKSENEIKVIMTSDAAQFISPLTLSVLSKNKVHINFFEESEWENHVKLALWADLFIIAPATANTISKMANGICDNFLLATYLSARCKVCVAPAMDLDMLQHPSTIKNLETIQKHGNIIIPSEEGELASGLYGKGRMAEPENIFSFVQQYFQKQSDFIAKKVIITSGATREAIDPVRYISNHSTGKMGCAIAEVFLQRGANVVFVCGKSSVKPKPQANLQIVEINSAEDMYNAVLREYASCDIAVFAAAVADYTPKIVSETKIKKNSEMLELTLTKTKDIAYEMGLLKKKNQLNIGFALETDNEQEYALKKIQKKNFDAIVLNSLQDKGAGFASDTNKITIFDTLKNALQFDLKNKTEVAQDIVNFIKQKLSQ